MKPDETITFITPKEWPVAFVARGIQESREYGGRTFTRHGSSVSVVSQAEADRLADEDMRRKFFVAETGRQDVLCQCGSTEFSLRYGTNEILATCGKCRLEASVYSG